MSAAVLAGAAALALSSSLLADVPSAEPVAAPAAASPASPPAPETSRLERRVAARIEEARAAVLAEPGSALAWGHDAMVLHAHSFHEEALACYREARRLDPGSFAWSYLMALVLEELPDPEDEAIQELRRAAELDPSYRLVALRLGDALLKRGRAEEAVDAYREAAAAMPELSAARRGLGLALLQLGRPEEALAALDRAHAIDARDRTTESSRARALAQLGRTDEARAVAASARGLPASPEVPDEILARAGSLGVSSLVCWRRGRLLLGMGRIDEAIANLEIVAEEKADDPQVHRVLATAYLRAGRPVQALVQEDKALQLDASSAEAWGVLLGLLNQLGDTKAAIGQGRLALTHVPADPQVNAQLALALERSGELGEAERHYRRSLEEGGDQAAVHFNLGLLLAKSGRRDEGIEHLRRAGELDAELPVAALLTKLGAAP